MTISQANYSHKNSIQMFRSSKLKHFPLQYMMDEHTTDDSFITRRFYSSILLRSKERIRIDFILDKHITDKSFIERFYWKMKLSLEKVFSLHSIIDKHMTQESSHQNSRQILRSSQPIYFPTLFCDRRTYDQWINQKKILWKYFPQVEGKILKWI